MTHWATSIDNVASSLPILIMKYKHQKKPKNTRHISIISKWHSGHTQLQERYQARNQTSEGHIARNKMDTHADTCCARENWSLLDLTGEICDVNPFLDTYQPILMEIPVARCCTVWTDQVNSQEYLLVGDQKLWFST
jgi:hypothetical protein